MTNGEMRRNRRRYRIRYDRIVVMVLILAVIIVLASSCTMLLTGKRNEGTKKPAKNPTDTTQPSTEATTTPENNAPTKEPPHEVEGDPSEDGYVFTRYSHDSVYKGDLIVVNADNECKFMEGDISILTVYNNKSSCYGAGDYETALDTTVLTQLNNMMEAFALYKGITTSDIYVQDGFRTFAKQEELHAAGKSKTFEAGHCDYHTGRTFDLYRVDSSSSWGSSTLSPTGNYEWFADNACSYGFIVRYPEGKQEFTGENPRDYTYRYVGPAHATYIKENGLCLEEYISLLKSHTKDSPITTTANGMSYSIYYVPAEDGETKIPVPDGSRFEISGNNSDGFIVTVPNAIP